MQLEVGKYYKTRGGRKVGPMVVENVVEWFGKDSVDPHGLLDGLIGIWTQSGRADFFTREEPKNRIYDLIAEWTDEPAQPAQLTAIEHLRKACELFLAGGNNKAAFDVLGVVLDHE